MLWTKAFTKVFHMQAGVAVIGTGPLQPTLEALDIEIDAAFLPMPAFNLYWQLW